MDPVTIVAAALQAGAAAGVKSAANQTVRDAYDRLKSLIRRRFDGDAYSEEVLNSLQDNPTVNDIALLRMLSQAEIEWSDPEVEISRQLLSQVDEQGTRVGKYSITVQGAAGIQIGDHNTQTNTFS